MSYLRWSYSNWYVYWTTNCGKDVVQIWHNKGGSFLYNFNDDIDDFIKQFYGDVSDEDKEELKEALIEANKDYNEQKEEE